MFEIVGEINHLAAGEIEIDAANPARAGSHLRDRFRRNIDAEEMKLAFDAGFEIKRLAVLRPFQATRNQIEAVGRQH